MPETDVDYCIWQFRDQNRIEDYFFEVTEGHHTAWWTHGAETTGDEAFCACFGCGFD